MLTLLIGGARSGKSAFAERLAAASGDPVVFIATMEPLDDDVRARIAVHQQSRPPEWRTIEAPRDLLTALNQHTTASDTVVIDCVTLWVSNLLLASLGESDNPAPADAERALAAIDKASRALIEQITSRSGESIVVTNEVGMGVVPAYALGRLFRDALGRVNALFATRADRVYSLTAGLALELKAAGAVPIDAFEAPRT
jgi:adenosylcobinamide kinase/adenosylcobinamide-phosphate guanylyltransferase